MSRLNSKGSFGELGPGDLEMLLLRLRMRKGRGRVGWSSETHQKTLGAGTPSIPVSIVQVL